MDDEVVSNYDPDLEAAAAAIPGADDDDRTVGTSMAPDNDSESNPDESTVPGGGGAASGDESDGDPSAGAFDPDLDVDPDIAREAPDDPAPGGLPE